MRNLSKFKDLEIEGEPDGFEREDLFEEFAGEFKSPEDLEEEFDEAGLDYREIEREHFGENDW